MTYSIALHIVGFSMWLVGLMILTNLLKSLCSEKGLQSINLTEIAPRLNRIGFGFVLPGLALALCSGIYQMLSVGMSLYMQQGWFHTKLTLVVILLVVTALSIAQLLKVGRGERVIASSVGKLHAFSGALLVAIVFLTILGR